MARLADVLTEPAFGITFERLPTPPLPTDPPVDPATWICSRIEGRAIVMHPQTVQVLCIQHTRLMDRITGYINLDSEWVALER